MEFLFPRKTEKKEYFNNESVEIMREKSLIRSFWHVQFQRDGWEKSVERKFTKV